jgi:hypothetical protein
VKTSRKILIAVILISLLPLYWIGSEWWYARSIRPTGISTLADFYARFGQPSSIRETQRDGATYYHLSGHWPSLPVWICATPSSPPAYVFDHSGRFVEWCSDPGDSTSYWERWPEKGSHVVSTNDFAHQYGL